MGIAALCRSVIELWPGTPVAVPRPTQLKPWWGIKQPGQFAGQTVSEGSLASNGGPVFLALLLLILLEGTGKLGTLDPLL
jgi:hypothetical protein